ncbi:hypothetical protein PVAG01_01068 [Phlyctema vagabunda]|uniref:Uncharacterized protein n=1 Tax=Phlyctema vagabunda TaxID=108571 RepID=A0ABR4PW31_9HELO
MPLIIKVYYTSKVQHNDRHLLDLPRENQGPEQTSPNSPSVPTPPDMLTLTSEPNQLWASAPYENVMMQEELVKTFPSERAACAEVQAWMTKYRATLGPINPRFGRLIFHGFDGRKFHDMPTYELEKKLAGCPWTKAPVVIEEMLQGFIAGRMRYRIEKAKREKAEAEARTVSAAEYIDNLRRRDQRVLGSL